MAEFHRKLLRKRGTTLWLTHDGSFSEDVTKACEVSTFTEAIRRCPPDTSVELVLKFDDPAMDIVIPLGDPPRAERETPK